MTKLKIGLNHVELQTNKTSVGTILELLLKVLLKVYFIDGEDEL